MLTLVIWAMLTGLVTGGVWVAIVLKQHQKKLADMQPELLDRIEERMAELEHLDQRLAEVEERLDFTERIQRNTQLPPIQPPPPIPPVS